MSVHTREPGRRAARPAVEVLGPWLQNNGDVLNLWSMAARLGSRADLAVSSTLGLDRLPPQPPLHWVQWRRDRTALRRALRSRSLGRMARFIEDAALTWMAPRGRRLRARGLVAGHTLAGLLDCSGYAYGDIWSTHRPRRRAAYYAKFRRRGIPVMVLPQAFGPFEEATKRDVYAALFAQCDLVYGRDRVSCDHLRTLGVGDKVRGPVPDITHLLDGLDPPDRAVWARRVCVVPNGRMLDRTAPEVGSRYADVLLAAIATIRKLRFDPVLLLHEKNDQSLAGDLAQRAGGEVPILYEEARVSKGMLGASHAVIGSRYHALVSALSQGVPTLGTSWSHKYEALFADYECTEHLLTLRDGGPDVTSRVTALIDPATRAERQRRLAACAARHKAAVQQMWQEIEARLWPPGGHRSTPGDTGRSEGATA